MAHRSFSLYMPEGREDMDALLSICIANAPTRKGTEYIFNRLLLLNQIHPEAFGDSLVPFITGQDKSWDANSLVQELKYNKEFSRQLADILIGDLRGQQNSAFAAAVHVPSLADQIPIEDVLTVPDDTVDASKDILLAGLAAFGWNIGEDG